ncbi:MAG: hypothetical protein LQ352_007931 [Teloschistes flavicans]|nr:MAG: hypothetical protein LQ352_007931 [Teloschistes flavicans]
MATFVSQILGLAALSSLASCAVLSGASEPIIDISHTANFSAIPLSPSAWLPENATPNISYSQLGQMLDAVGTPPYKCDPQSYGQNLHIESCREALLAVPANSRRLKLGLRDQRNDVNLPYRFLSHDAVCFIEISPPAFGTYDIVTGLELARAAFSIVEGCVSDVGAGQPGGFVRGLGPMRTSRSPHSSTNDRLRLDPQRHVYQSCGEDVRTTTQRE